MQKKLFQLFVCAVIVLRIPGKNKTEGKRPRFRVLLRDMRRITSSEQPRRPDRCVQ